MFSRACRYRVHVFLSLAPHACFPALVGTGCMFSRACWYRLHVFPRLLVPVACFPALVGTGCMFSRACWYRLHVFPRLLVPGACFPAVGTERMFSRSWYRPPVIPIEPVSYLRACGRFLWLRKREELCAFYSSKLLAPLFFGVDTE